MNDPTRRFYSLSLLLILTAASSALAFAAQARQLVSDSKQLIRQADRLVDRGNYDQAEKLLFQALDLNKNDAAVRLKLAMVFIKQRRIADAYKYSFDVAKNNPKNAMAFAVLGTALITAGRLAEARPILYTALSLDRRNATAWASLGLLEFFENNIDLSVRDLNEAIFLDPQNADNYFTFAQVSARAENYRDAADAYNRFLSVSRNVDDERRVRIRGLINFLQFLGQKTSLYTPSGEAETVVPFDLPSNRPVVDVVVNNRSEPLKFVLDTGSGISVISDQTAKRLGIKPITRGGFAKGIGGSGKFEIVYGFLKQVQIGGVKVRNVPVYIRKFHSTTQNIDGYIGLSLISKFLATVDYGSRTISFKRGAALPVTGQPNAAAGGALPLRLTSSGFLSGEVQLAGVTGPLNFIVDTGASVSVIAEDIAKLPVIKPLVSDERVRVIGAAGITDEVRSYLLPKLTVGSQSRGDVAAVALDLGLINEASGFEQAGILGGNFLKNFRLTFDFKNSKVILVPIDAKTGPRQAVE